MAEGITNSEGVLDDAGMVQPDTGLETPSQAPATEATIQSSVLETTAPVEINSLQDAMQAFNQAKSKAAETDLSKRGSSQGSETKPGEPDSGATAATNPVSTDGNVDAGQFDNTATLPEFTNTAASTVPGGAGEYAGDDEVYDVDAGISEVRQQLTNIAVDAVRKEFASKNINKISINDLMKVDERSGTKEFINPDTNRPFSSSNPRSEAQAFVRDYNADLDAQFGQRCHAIMPNIERSYSPVLEFHSFLPTWQKMDPFRQEMFEELVDGHELRDKQGSIVGYDCDLNAISNQMERQISWLLSKQQAYAPAASTTSTAPAVADDPIRQPAVAAKAKLNTNSDGKEFDLSNMSDAIKFYNQQKKKGK